MESAGGSEGTGSDDGVLTRAELDELKDFGSVRAWDASTPQERARVEALYARPFPVANRDSGVRAVVATAMTYRRRLMVRALVGQPLVRE